MTQHYSGLASGPCQSSNSFHLQTLSAFDTDYTFHHKYLLEQSLLFYQCCQQNSKVIFGLFITDGKIHHFNMGFSDCISVTSLPPQTLCKILTASVYYLRKFLSALHNLLCEPLGFLFFSFFSFCCITSLIHRKPYQWKDFYHTLAMVEFSGCIHTERSSSP